MKPGKDQKKKKDAKIYVGRSTTLHSLLFCLHTPCMSYEIKIYVLVSSSISGKQLYCILCTVRAKIENKNIQQ